VKIQRFIVLGVILAGALTYHNSFSGAFVFDDIPHILENIRIRQLWPPWNLVTHSSRPVVDLSLAVNYALGGLNPWGYHLFNLVIHVLAALTLYSVLRRTFVSERLRPTFGRAAWSLAGVSALIWLVHPLQTESVTYTIQRAESLMSLFYLLTLYCVIRSNDASRENLWKIGAVASCALGMACKPVMITAPLVALLYDRALLVKSWRDVRQRRCWVYAGLAASWLLLPLLLANAPTEWKTSAGFEFEGIPPLHYALTESVVILRYLRLVFWPQPLCLDYGWEYQWRTLVGAGDVWLDLMVVVALLAGTIWAWNRRPPMGFLGAWFFLTLAPTSSFIPIADPIAEHRMYLPLAAIVTAVVVAAFGFGKQLLKPRSRLVLGWVACGFVIVPLIAVTIQRNRDYTSELAIWQDTVTKCPQNPRAFCNLGFALLQLHRVAEAEEQFEQALRINPNYADAHNNLGYALMETGKIAEGLEQCEQAVRIKPDYAEAHCNLGNGLMRLGKMPEAIEQLEQALRINPNLAEAHNNLGYVLMETGKIAEGIEQCEQALHIKPDMADAHNNLGNALMGSGRLLEAIGQFEQALRIKREYVEAHYNLGVALERAGRLPEAIGEYRQALQIRPDLAAAQQALARLQVH
jgi:tetratricopeptide (TPR) repeat protein